MPINLDANSALNVATTSLQAIRKFAEPNYATNPLTPGEKVYISPTRISSPNGVNLPEGMVSSSSARSQAYITIDYAQQMVAASLTAAHQILETLDSASSLVNIAAFTSLTSRNTGISPDGTRLSGLTIKGVANRLTETIDTLVKSVSQKGLNLISSSSPPIRIQTTEFGGRLTITPQPMDTFSLNLLNLDTIDKSDAKEAKGRLDGARQAVLRSIQYLEALQRSLNFGTAMSRNFSAISAPIESSPPRGVLIDLYT